MRKVFAVLVAASLVFGAFGGEAVAGKKKKKKTRTATAEYSGPSPGVPGASACFPGTLGCVSFPTGSKERFVAVEITDQTGTPVPGAVTQDLDGDGSSDTSTPFCGTSDGPVPIEPGFEVTLRVYATGGANACGGAATTGQIKLKFSNLP